MKEAHSFKASSEFESKEEADAFLDELREDLHNRLATSDAVAVELEVSSNNLPLFMKGVMGEEQNDPVGDGLDEESHKIDFEE